MVDARRLLILNPNTSAALTARLLARARQIAPDWVALEALTAEEGPDYIRDAEDLARAEATVARMAGRLAGAPPDAILLACFGDPGVEAASRALGRPVIGMAAASCAAAAAGGRPFSLVTGGRAWGPILEDFVERRGLGRRLVSVETLEMTGDALSADPSAALEALGAAAEAGAAKGAEAVVIGGAGVAGLASAMPPREGVEILDSLDCALAAAFKALESAQGKA
ncbi:MAG: aspartate/glutamate racemase family protein [Pikeienuella sp.]|uniref:aspartate/glutamate racemase family protein n=1 Tax=Pikeienuella sp. TaxID=2831957 RepID=UPI00391DC6A6